MPNATDAGVPPEGQGAGGGLTDEEQDEADVERVREGIFADDRQTFTQCGEAIDALNRLSASLASSRATITELREKLEKSEAQAGRLFEQALDANDARVRLEARTPGCDFSAKVAGSEWRMVCEASRGHAGGHVFSANPQTPPTWTGPSGVPPEGRGAGGSPGLTVEEHTVEEQVRQDWRYGFLCASEVTRPGAERISGDIKLASSRVENTLNEVGKRGSAGAWLGNETLLAMRHVLVALASSRATITRLTGECGKAMLAGTRVREQLVDAEATITRLEGERADYERFQRSTHKELADRDAALRDLQARALTAEGRYHTLRRLCFEDFEAVERIRCLSPADFDAEVAALSSSPTPDPGAE